MSKGVMNSPSRPSRYPGLLSMGGVYDSWDMENIRYIRAKSQADFLKEETIRDDHLMLVNTNRDGDGHPHRVNHSYNSQSSSICGDGASDQEGSIYSAGYPDSTKSGMHNNHNLGGNFILRANGALGNQNGGFLGTRTKTRTGAAFLGQFPYHGEATGTADAGLELDRIIPEEEERLFSPVEQDEDFIKGRLFQVREEEHLLDDCYLLDVLTIRNESVFKEKKSPVYYHGGSPIYSKNPHQKHPDSRLELRKVDEMRKPSRIPVFVGKKVTQGGLYSTNNTSDDLQTAEALLLESIREEMFKRSNLGKKEEEKITINDDNEEMIRPVVGVVTRSFSTSTNHSTSTDGSSVDEGIQSDHNSSDNPGETLLEKDHTQGYRSSVRPRGCGRDSRSSRSRSICSDLSDPDLGQDLLGHRRRTSRSKSRGSSTCPFCSDNSSTSSYYYLNQKCQQNSRNKSRSSSALSKASSAGSSSRRFIEGVASSDDNSPYYVKLRKNLMFMYNKQNDGGVPTPTNFGMDKQGQLAIDYSSNWKGLENYVKKLQLST